MTSFSPENRCHNLAAHHAHLRPLLIEALRSSIGLIGEVNYFVGEAFDPESRSLESNMTSASTDAETTRTICVLDGGRPDKIQFPFQNLNIHVKKKRSGLLSPRLAG